MAVAQPESKILVGTLLVGKYRVEREIGRGGMAAVYEAEHIALGKKVAVKVLAAELSNSAIVIERFFREARAAASVKSPYIVEVYDSGRLEDGRPFIAMEYLDGESLYDRMARVRLIDPVTTVRVISQCAKGLMKAHALGIVHRDLKPENIHLTKTEEGEEVAKILDFGLAKFYAPVRTDEKTARLTREGAVFGTPAYMSPEQVKGQGSVDHRADLWALGCMAFECLTGRPVWNTDQGVAMTFAAIAAASPPIPSRLRPDLPPAFDTWFKKALERDAARRFQTAKELADALSKAFNSPHLSLVNVGMSDLERVAEAAEELPSETVHLMESERPPPALVPAASSRDSDEAAGPRSARGPREQAPSATDLPPTAAPDLPVPPRPASTGVTRYVVSGLALGGAILGAYFAYTKVLHPQMSSPVVESTASTGAGTLNSTTRPLPSVPASQQPQDEPRWQMLVAEAQQLLAAGEPDAALAKLKEASAQGGGALAKAMLEQVGIAKLTPGPCQLRGFAHPRTGYAGNVGRPSVAAVAKGAIIAWADDHESSHHDHAYAVLVDAAGHIIDPAGKESTAPRDITPEGDSVVRPSLYGADDKIILLYWDDHAKEPNAGVRVRWLDGDGRIDGNSILVNHGKPGAYWPTLARVPEAGDFWVAWQEDRDKEGEDLFLRHLDPQLSPLGQEIRATDYVAPEKGKAPRIDVPAVAIGRKNVFVTYALERDKKQLIERMRIPLASPALAAGLDERPSVTPQPGSTPEKRKDRELGDDVSLVNEDKSTAVNPDMACNREGCFIVWHEPPRSAQAAMIDPDKGLVIWRKKLTSSGGHPAVGVAPDGTVQVVYYEATKFDVRIRIATLSRDTIVGTTSTFAKASNPELKRPWIAPGKAKGEWFVAWQDVEGGHTEAYVARLVCK